MTRKTIEYSPHHVEPPAPPVEFGNPDAIKAYGRRRGRSHAVVPPGNRRVFSDASLAVITPLLKDDVVDKKGKREWENYVLQKGTGVEQAVQGRSYTIGRDHPLIDIWTSPPDTWGAQRVAAVNNCRIIVLKKEKPTDKDSSDISPAGWTQAVVIEGVSSRLGSLRPIEFRNGLGTQIFVSAQWSQIRARRR